MSGALTPYIKESSLENSKCEFGGTGLCGQMKESDLVQLVHTAILKTDYCTFSCMCMARGGGGDGDSMRATSAAKDRGITPPNHSALHLQLV